MSNYTKQKDWETSKHTLIKKELSRILSPCGSDKYHYVFEEAPHEMDCKQCTDLIDHRKRKYGLRIRNAESYTKVPNQWLNEITIRKKNKSNTKTEITKIQNGYLDFYFYCWVCDNTIVASHLFDAKTLIKLLKEHENKAKTIENDDGTEGIVYPIEFLKEAIWSKHE